MRRVVKYTAIDPYYSDQTQTYIGASWAEIDFIQSETEKYMAQCHGGWLSRIYRTEVIEDTEINFEKLLLKTK